MMALLPACMKYMLRSRASPHGTSHVPAFNERKCTSRNNSLNGSKCSLCLLIFSCVILKAIPLIVFGRCAAAHTHVDEAHFSARFYACERRGGRGACRLWSELWLLMFS